MSTLSPASISESTLLRLTNLTRQKGKLLLAELGIEPVAVVGRVRIYPAETIGRLLSAEAKIKSRALSINHTKRTE
jgi:hypothetical protein